MRDDTDTITASTPNWSAIEELLNHLIDFAKRGLESKFNMGKWIALACDPNERRSRDQESCYSSACLAGHTLLMQGMTHDKVKGWMIGDARVFVLDIMGQAARYLGLAHPADQKWMFYGLWHPSQEFYRNLGPSHTFLDAGAAGRMSLNDAIIYLRKVLAERKVRVTIDEELVAQEKEQEVPRERAD